MVIAPDDYPGKRYRNRYIYEHHYILWKIKGIVLNKDQVLHHKNGLKRDNRIENLEIQLNQDHRKEHGQDRRQKALIKTKCGFCKKQIAMQGAHFRSRIRASKWKKIFCSRNCGANHQYKIQGWRSG